jgi:hypothetical protein
MSRSIGQILRLIGLAIEVGGISAQILWTKTDPAGTPLPGQFSARQVWIVVGVGFVVWMIGTILTYWPRPAVTSRPAGDNSGQLKL